MLRELHIENLAIIEKSTVAFGNRFNVFSGETGAGKSILIGGINAVLGERVYKDSVRAGANKAVVTALFDQLPEFTREKLSEYGYESEDNELTLTREISPDGKSVARINGRTATAAVLKEIAAGLIDIHGQHETRLIVSADSQLELIDSFGGISLLEYEKAFREFSAVNKKIKAFQNETLLKDEKIALLSDRLGDLSPYKLKKGEEEEVSRELERLRGIRNVSHALQKAYCSISGTSDDSGAIELLQIGKTSLGEVAELIPDGKELKSRLDSVVIELDDIKREISPLISESHETDRLSYLEERMSDFLRLKRKYKMDIDALADKINEWQSELDGLRGGEDTQEKLLAEKKRLGDQVRALAETVTSLRKKTADKLAELIKRELIYLDMPEVRLLFNITREKVTIKGMDGVDMLISVNKGTQPMPVAKIASGGELARIMLAIKSVIAKNDDIPTMIFDEVDSGISGRAAHKVGVKLAELSGQRQVLCVTHLAQIAAMADEHFLIEKDDDGTRTYTRVKRVEGEERKRELARIISGDDDEISLKNAQRLIERKP